MKKILVVVGTRPNFVKVALFKEAFRDKNNIELMFVHTGQHYDPNMVDVFFKQLSLQPDYCLDLRLTSPQSLMLEIQQGLEGIITCYSPDLIIAVGDVNSTLATARAANNSNISLAHIESGLRSFDDTMVEEYNRKETDRLSDYLFVTEKSGVENLLNEGRNEENIFNTGNTMIDPLVLFDKQIKEDSILRELRLKAESFILLTMHRPENVDTEMGLLQLLTLIREINHLPIVFPIHPRTKKNLMNFKIWESMTCVKNLVLCDPLGYFAFQNLLLNCTLVLTDSGGVSEEATYRAKPCISLRKNTERPITVDIGSNTILNFDIVQIKQIIDKVKKSEYKGSSVPQFWDGRATWRIADTLNKLLSNAVEK